MTLTWPIDLSQPPKVAAIAKNIHGHLPSERFLLPELWSLHLYRYSGDLIVQGHSLPIRPGHAAVVPPGVMHEYRYRGVSPHLYVHFQLPNIDSPHLIPAMQDLGERFSVAYERLSQVIGRTERGQVKARVWDLLWELASPPVADGGRAEQHPSVELATRLIEERLSRSLSVSQLAREADITPSYLTKLFREVHGESVLGHIRRRRMQQAVHLLQNSTMPIKAVAASVGYPDLQHFNKVVRSETGNSPRGIRELGAMPKSW